MRAKQRVKCKAAVRLLGTVFVSLVLVTGMAQAQVVDYLFDTPDYQLSGVNADDTAGQVVAYGDVNGDGLADMVIGAPGFDYMGRSNCGVVYIVLSSDTLTSPIDFADDRPDLKRVYGPNDNSRLGSVLACGDIDGDNRDEILCGIPLATVNGKVQAGEVYMVPGDAQPADEIDLASPPASVTHVLGRSVFDKLGSSIAIGDIDNDTFGDMVIGAPFSESSTGFASGKVFVIYGSQNPDALIDLASTSARITEIFGANGNDTFGTSCHSIDIDKDGADDILAGAPEASPLGRNRAGIVYLIPGSPNLPDTIQTAEASANEIAQIFGETAGAATGSAVCAGDYDGDTIQDVILSAPELSPEGRSQAGAVYVVTKANTWPATVDLAGASSFATRIDGAGANLNIGLAIDAADFNMDGLDDVAIGVPKTTPSAGRSEAGKVYIIFGRVNPSQIDTDVTLAPGIMSVWGAATDNHVGSSVAAGAMTSSGFADLLIGANDYKVGNSLSVGQAFVVLGSSEITPTQVFFYNANVLASGVHLEWVLGDDIDPALIRVLRREAGSGTTDLLAAAGVRRTGRGRYEYMDHDVTAGSSYTYTVATEGSDPQIIFTVTVSTPILDRARLQHAYPNPFTAQTTVAFEIPESGHVAVRIYDIKGALVATLGDSRFAAGMSQLSWNGHNRLGTAAPSGIYFVRMDYRGATEQRKLLLLR